MSALVQKGVAHGRPMALAITIAVHVAVVAGLLTIKVVEAVSDHVTPIPVQSFEKKPVPVPVERIADPRLGDPVAVPATVPDIPSFPAEESITAIVVDPESAVVTRETPRITDVRPTVPDTPLRYQAVRPADDYYPPQALRVGAEGAAIVRACVDAAGRLSAAPSVVKTSRQPSLDAAAVKWAGEALHFQPATRGGAAISSCKDFRVSFTLH